MRDPGKLPNRYRTKSPVLKDASQLINGQQLGDPEAPPPPTDTSTTSTTTSTTSTGAGTG